MHAPQPVTNERIKKQQKTENIMIIMPVKEGENIERALKKFKRKYERTGVLTRCPNRWHTPRKSR